MLESFYSVVFPKYPLPLYMRDPQPTMRVVFFETVLFFPNIVQPFHLPKIQTHETPEGPIPRVVSYVLWSKLNQSGKLSFIQVPWLQPLMLVHPKSYFGCIPPLKPPPPNLPPKPPKAQPPTPTSQLPNLQTSQPPSLPTCQPPNLPTSQPPNLPTSQPPPQPPNCQLPPCSQPPNLLCSVSGTCSTEKTATKGEQDTFTRQRSAQSGGTEKRHALHVTPDTHTCPTPHTTFQRFQGRLEVGRLGGWEVGRLGGWEVGRLGGWEVGRWGGWEVGR